MVALESAVRESQPVRYAARWKKWSRESAWATLRKRRSPACMREFRSETFLLFFVGTWPCNGKPAAVWRPTLATVGRTIRDRVEFSRRIRSNTIQSQLSTMAVLGVTYFLALVFWRSNPTQMSEFLDTRIGQWLCRRLDPAASGWLPLDVGHQPDEILTPFSPLAASLATRFAVAAANGEQADTGQRGQ